jgi:hypothetical protein
MDRLSKSLDPIALIIGGVVALLGVFGMFSKLGLTVDEIQIVEGALLAIAAGTRKWIIDARTTTDKEPDQDTPQD